MFTGIIEEVGRVASFSGRSLTISADKVVRGVALGDSIGVNGICLTVNRFDEHSFTVDVMGETLARTTLKDLKPGNLVNLESALTLQKPLGGHLVQGHVDDVGEIESLSRQDETTIIRVATSPKVMRYIVEKGFIAVNGISLTVVSRDDLGFIVSIVNFTWDHTSLSSLMVGSKVNLEADVLAKYVEQLSSNNRNSISLEFLQAHGFTS